jgi:hypothetical protein
LSTTGGFKKLKDNMGLIQKLPTQDRSPKNNHWKDSKHRNTNQKSYFIQGQNGIQNAPLLSIEALKIIILKIAKEEIQN